MSAAADLPTFSHPRTRELADFLAERRAQWALAVGGYEARHAGQIRETAQALDPAVGGGRGGAA